MTVAETIAAAATRVKRAPSPDCLFSRSGPEVVFPGYDADDPVFFYNRQVEYRMGEEKPFDLPEGHQRGPRHDLADHVRAHRCAHRAPAPALHDVAQAEVSAERAAGIDHRRTT